MAKQPKTQVLPDMLENSSFHHSNQTLRLHLPPSSSSHPRSPLHHDMAAAGALVFAGKTVTAAVVKEIISKAFGYLNSYFGAETMSELKSKLDRGLPKIQAVLDIVSPDQVKDKSAALDTWFWQLRDAVEKAEDAIDEIEYFELEQEAKDRKVSDWGSSLAKTKNKVVNYVKDVKIIEKTVKRFTHRDTLKRLRKAVEELEKAAAGVSDFLALTDHLNRHTSLKEDGIQSSDRETGSMLTTFKVFGRHDEREEVLKWLTQTASEDSEIVLNSNHLSIFSIVGHGGMGKTTLARLICQDDDVTKHFKVIWVCVSTSFDAKAIISKILESLSLATPDAKSLEALQKILKEKLSSVKFLLVLDDVWEDKSSNQWKNLFAPLRQGKSGSKILLTTRMQSVADLAAIAMEAPHQCLPLHGLKENENIELFNSHAFSTASAQDYTALQKIGEKIATTVRACPLVVKVVASYLRYNLTFEYWKNFLDQDLAHFEGNEKDIMDVLKLSYFQLPTEVQACFRYCSIFPQDYIFRKDDLVEMWVSSGLISQVASKSQSNPLDIGEQYLVQLTRKSFFDMRSSLLGGEEGIYYVMHDLMHDLAKCVSIGECAQIVDVSSLDNAPNTVRHICIENMSNLPVEKIKKITLMENLRTIIIPNYMEENIKTDALKTVEELVESSKSLRLFESTLCHSSDFSDKLAKLYHLRFVKLGEVPPQSICGFVKLYHLTTLACGHQNVTPKNMRDFGYLDRLRYVTYGSNGWGEFPVSRLNCLRVLEDYHIQVVQGYSLCALKDLKCLRMLDVKSLENVDKQEEAKEADFKGKRHLESLSLEWSGCYGARSTTEELILDNLEPHVNLKELRISGFSGTRMPHWITKPSVENVTILELKRCKYLEQLPILEILTLKKLELEDLPSLITIGQAIDVSVDEPTELFLPPKLQIFYASQCPKLGELPFLPSSLVTLELYEVGLTKLPRIENRYHGNASTISPKLLEIHVEDCQKLVSLEGSLFEQKQYMGVLHSVGIINCVQLEYAPLLFEEMNKLQYSAIKRCPKLRMLRGSKEILLPPSVRHLHIEMCGDLEDPLLKSFQCTTHLTLLGLSNCSSLTTLPSADVFSKNLKSLRAFNIAGCDNLISLGGLGSLPRLGMLRIRQCRKLVEATRSSQTGYASAGEEELGVDLQVDTLDIDLPSLLLVQPLRSLCHTRSLNMWDASETTGLSEEWLLQNCTSLQRLLISKAESLPQCIGQMSALKYLDLFSAGEIRSLPDLPLSLGHLGIDPCHPDLERNIEGRRSPGWDRISHVPRVQIGERCFILGMECSRETFLQLRDEDFNTLSSWANQQKDGYNAVKKTLAWLSHSKCCKIKSV